MSNSIWLRTLFLMGIIISRLYSFSWSSTVSHSIQQSRRVQPLRMVAMNYKQKEGKIDLLYDSECPICAMEVEFLKKRDLYKRIVFTDLQALDYDPAEHGNVEFERGMRKLRAVLPDNTVVTGVEVFRLTYQAIGLGWMFAITKLPVVGDLADAVYDVWAENRLRLTGRGELADIVKERSEALKEFEVDECDSDACELDWGDDEDDEFTERQVDL